MQAAFRLVVIDETECVAVKYTGAGSVKIDPDSAGLDLTHQNIDLSPLELTHKGAAVLLGSATREHLHYSTMIR